MVAQTPSQQRTIQELSRNYSPVGGFVDLFENPNCILRFERARITFKACFTALWQTLFPYFF
tara:strand:- start:799 stop:984 length:186 start_codon:yes stop_codon:yes gene_type:complete